MNSNSRIVGWSTLAFQAAVVSLVVWQAWRILAVTGAGEPFTMTTDMMSHGISWTGQ